MEASSILHRLLAAGMVLAQQRQPQGILACREAASSVSEPLMVSAGNRARKKTRLATAWQVEHADKDRGSQKDQHLLTVMLHCAKDIS